MPIANTDQRVNIKKYDQNFDRIFGKKNISLDEIDLPLATKLCVESCQEEQDGNRIFYDVTILVLSKSRALFEGKYRTCNVSQSKTIVPEYTIGVMEATGMHVEPGSDVLNITARGKV